MTVPTQRTLAAQVEGLQQTVSHLACTVTQLRSQLDRHRRIGRGLSAIGFARWTGWLGGRDRALRLSAAPRPNVRRTCHDRG